MRKGLMSANPMFHPNPYGAADRRQSLGASPPPGEGAQPESPTATTPWGEIPLLLSPSGGCLQQCPELEGLQEVPRPGLLSRLPCAPSPQSHRWIHGLH